MTNKTISLWRHFSYDQRIQFSFIHIYLCHNQDPFCVDNLTTRGRHLSNTTVCTIMIIYLIKCKNSFNLKKNDEKWHFLGVLQKIIKNNQRIIKKRLNFICKILRYSFVHIKDLTDELVVCKCLKVCSIAYLEVASICSCKKKKKTFATLPYFFQIKRVFKLPSRCNRWLIKYWLWFL